jgi:hypothetical protein
MECYFKWCMYNNDNGDCMSQSHFVLCDYQQARKQVVDMQLDMQDMADALEECNAGEDW